jgi:type IV secretory pathway VirB6-like protein
MDGDPSNVNPQQRIGIVEKLYTSLISNPQYKLILKLSLVLFIMFYGLGYLMGVSELSQSQIVVRVFKIGFIYLFVGETGWIWFKNIFVNIFKDGILQASFLMASAFDSSSQIEEAIRTNNYQSTAILFSSVDNVISMIFSPSVNKKIWAFLFTGIFGWAYILVFYFSIINYIYALSNAVLLFITAQIMISILFIIGPLFFIFLLFSQTKDMFDNWLKALISNGLQIVFLITTLSFFNMLMVEVLKMALSYKVCWDDAWVINLGVRVTLTQFWTIPTLPPRVNMSEDLINTGNADAIPSFFSIIYIWIISSLTTSMITFMTNAAATISEGLKASEVGSGVKALAAQAKNGLAGIAQTQLWNRTVGGALDKLDNKLFDSGKTAKNERANKIKQSKKDFENKSKLAIAANEAEKKFKQDPDNIKKLMDKSQEDQKKILQDVRQKAMEEKGEKMGLNKQEVSKLVRDSGLKYHGTNVFGAMFQGAKQAILNGGTISKSLNDQANTKLKRSEAVNAMNKMNNKDREEFAKRIKQGDINVSNKLTQKLKKNPFKAGIRGMGKLAGKINDKVNPWNKDFNKAARLLEAEGKITPNIKDFARNDKERAMIRNQVIINREAVKKLTGKEKVSNSLLKKARAENIEKIKKQKKILKNLLKNNSQNARLIELNDAINKAENIDDENSREVLDEFAEIDNLNDNDKVDGFLNQDNVKNLQRDNDEN